MKRILVGLMVLVGVPLLVPGAVYYDIKVVRGLEGVKTTAGLKSAGQFLVSSKDGTPSSFTSYCMDVELGLDTTYRYQFTVTQTYPLDHAWDYSQQGPEKASYLYRMYNGAVEAMPNTTPAEKQAGNVQAAALQAAIWSVLSGKKDSDNYWFAVKEDTGNEIQQQVHNAWDFYLSGIPDNAAWISSFWEPNSAQYELPDQQGLIGPPVPEPKDFGIAGVLLLAGFAGWEIRRRRSVSAERPS